ncbi:MAG: DUF2889 domain-containing protein [Desulfuromonadaceae bacterium]|nr:DUF2889 domain-containing protein [Desulfuromonadaceae bacterium]
MATLNDRFHDVRIEVLVDYDSLMVGSAKVDFVRYPSSDCPGVTRRMKELEGFVIGRGLNRKLQEVFGGGEGCGNLRVMLQGVLPLAMNVKAAAGLQMKRQCWIRSENGLRVVALVM